MKYNRVLITGSTGFIGMNMRQYLDERYIGPEIIWLDRENGGDLTEVSNVYQVWNRFEPDACINLAGITSIGESVRKPMKYADINIPIVVNILEACREYDTRLLQISTSEVYGTNQNESGWKVSVGGTPNLNPFKTLKPMSEDHPIAPHSPYAWSKTCQDRAVYSWYQTYEMDASIVRLFNPYGPHQNLKKMIPKTMIDIAKGNPITLYGEGKARRDWVFIEDIVDGIWAALWGLPAGDVVNICTGANYSTLELVEHIKTVMIDEKYDFRSKTIKIDHPEDKFGQVFSLLGDLSKAKRVLGWKSAYNLEKGLKKTLKWLENTILRKRVMKGKNEFEKT